MNNCKECGHALKDEAQFCTECGATVQQQVKTKAPSNRPTWGSKLKKITKKQKVIAISVLALLVLVIGGHLVLAKITDKDQIIKKFETALNEEDAKTIASMLKSSDKNMEITEENVSKLIALIAETPTAQRDYIDQLEFQAAAYEVDETLESSTIFSLKKDGKTALIYDNYMIEVTPFYFEVGTNMTDAKLFLGEEEIATSDSDEFTKEYGPVFPGEYTLRSSLSNDYGVLETESEIQLLEPHDQDQSVDLTLSGAYVDFEIEYADIAESVSYFINDTEVDTSSAETFGPVSADGSVETYAVLTFPWGEVTTEKTPIESRYFEIVVSSPFTEEMQSAINNTIHTFGKDFALANTALDATLFTTVTEAFKTETVDSDYSSMKKLNKSWKGTYKKSVIDLDSFKLSQEDGIYKLKVDAAQYYDDILRTYGDSETVKDEEIKDRLFILEYQAEENIWLVDKSVGLLASFNADNTVELVVEETE